MSDENNGQDPKGRFAPGNGGGGRPKGSRNKLGEKLIEDLYEHWQKNGMKAIEAMFEERPHEYVRAVVSILPREVKIENVDSMTDEELRNRIRQLAAGLGISIAGRTSGTGETAGSADAETGSNQTPPLRTLQ